MKLKMTLTFLVTAILAGTIGGYVGSRIGKEEEVRTLIHLQYQSVAAHMKLHVKLLEQLRDGQSEKASNMLEQLLDGDLLALEAYLDPPKGIPKDLSDNQINESLDRARSYRKRFPTQAEDSRVREAIEKVLRKPEYAPPKNK